MLVIFSFNDNTTPTLPLAGFTTHWYHIALGNDLLLAAVKRSAALAALNGVAGDAARHPRGARALGAARVCPAGRDGARDAAAGRAVRRPRRRHAGAPEDARPRAVADRRPLRARRRLGAVRRARDPARGSRRSTRRSRRPPATSGAGEITAFVRVTLPLIIPAILSSYLIAFTISFDEYAIASFLVPPGHDTFPIFLYSNARTPALRPQTVAIAGLVIAVSLTLVVVAEIGRRGRRAAAGGRLTPSAPERLGSLAHCASCSSQACTPRRLARSTASSSNGSPARSGPAGTRSTRRCCGAAGAGGSRRPSPTPACSVGRSRRRGGRGPTSSTPTTWCRPA